MARRGSRGLGRSAPPPPSSSRATSRTRWCAALGTRAALLPLLLVLAGGGCAPSLRVMAGSLDRAPLAVTAQVTSGNEAVRLTLAFDNRSDDPVAVDLDRVVLRTAAGEVLRVQGKTQRVRGALGGEVQRVALDSIVVDPHGKAESVLELASLPERGPMSLQLPALHRLGIDGQRPLPGLQIPLQHDEAASRQASRMYDPFEE